MNVDFAQPRHNEIDRLKKTDEKLESSTKRYGKLFTHSPTAATDQRSPIRYSVNIVFMSQT